jgi:hypothetical protein
MAARPTAATNSARATSRSCPGAVPEMHATSFQVTYEPAAEGRAQRGFVNADLLELEPLARLAEFLPFPADLRKLLRRARAARQPARCALRLDGRAAGCELVQPEDAFRRPGDQCVAHGARVLGALGQHRRERRRRDAAPGVAERGARRAEGLSRAARCARSADRPGAVGPRGVRAACVRVNGLAYGNRDLAGTAPGRTSTPGRAGNDRPHAQIARANAKNSVALPAARGDPGRGTREWLLYSIRPGARTTCGCA